mgnify:CR=1 FL=1
MKRLLTTCMLAAMVVTQLVGPAIEFAESLPVTVFVPLFLFAFPALVYTFLVAVWLIHLAQDVLRGMIR